MGTCIDKLNRITEWRTSFLQYDLLIIRPKTRFGTLAVPCIEEMLCIGLLNGPRMASLLGVLFRVRHHSCRIS
jgi:hypothetical protein